MALSMLINWIGTIVGIVTGAAALLTQPNLARDIAALSEHMEGKIAALSQRIDGDERLVIDAGNARDRELHLTDSSISHELEQYGKRLDALDAMIAVNSNSISGMKERIAGLMQGETVGARESAASLEKQIENVSARQNELSTERMRIVDEVIGRIANAEKRIDGLEQMIRPLSGGKP